MTSGESDRTFEQLLEYLKSTRGFDFTAYKPNSLRRRIEKRMQMVQTASYADYQDYLEVHPDEFALLFNTILINVTDFFRDAPVWEAVAETVLPRILSDRDPNEPIRVWSAGCASGQEAYTVAMLLAEQLGDEAFRERVKIYATDVDQEALNEGRTATYTAQQLQSVPPELRERYFEPANGRYGFRKDLRRAVIFGRNDLLQDSPISRLDLLICRNTLMYFNAEAQTRILQRFDFALRPTGFLLLGKAEVLLTRSSAFVPLDIKRRIFVKSSQGRPRERLAEPADVPVLAEAPATADEQRLRELAFEWDGTPQLVVDAAGNVVVANRRARQLFGLAQNGTSERLHDWQIPHRPLELRHLVEQALAERREAQLGPLEWHLDGGDRRLMEIAALPLIQPDDGVLGVKVVIDDITRFIHLQDELRQSRQALETANEELQSSNEELETTNEELQSTVEELETTNEELQSTNEELETMNEELQSTNEELESANEELRHRSDEVNALNLFLEAIMASLQDGVVVLDASLHVRAWNQRSEDLWGLRADEVRGQHFLGLDIGLPVAELRPMIRASLAGAQDGASDGMIIGAVNRRGKAIKVQVKASRLIGPANVLQGVILTLAEQKPDGTG